MYWEPDFYEGVIQIEYVLIDEVFSFKEIKDFDSWKKYIPLLSSNFDDVLKYIYEDENTSNDKYLYRAYPEGYPEEAIYFFK